MIWLGAYVRPFSRLNFSEIAFLSAGVPSTAVYLVSPASIARLAASLMFCGVSKSGSPALKPITSLPAAFSSFALSDMAMVGDGLMRCMRSAMKDMGELASGSEEKAALP